MHNENLPTQTQNSIKAKHVCEKDPATKKWVYRYKRTEEVRSSFDIFDIFQRKETTDNVPQTAEGQCNLPEETKIIPMPTPNLSGLPA